ncbi:sugar diacid recognition domain-containing protein, partial [Clostridium butyricum]
MLNKQIAQKIVDKISTVLPYNINIMDKEGIII